MLHRRCACRGGGGLEPDAGAGDCGRRGRAGDALVHEPGLACPARTAAGWCQPQLRARRQRAASTSRRAREGFGPFERACSLFSPMFQFEDQAAARWPPPRKCCWRPCARRRARRGAPPSPDAAPAWLLARRHAAAGAATRGPVSAEADLLAGRRSLRPGRRAGHRLRAPDLVSQTMMRRSPGAAALAARSSSAVCRARAGAPQHGEMAAVAAAIDLTAEPAASADCLWRAGRWREHLQRFALDLPSRVPHRHGPARWPGCARDAPLQAARPARARPSAAAHARRCRSGLERRVLACPRLCSACQLAAARSRHEWASVITSAGRVAAGVRAGGRRLPCRAAAAPRPAEPGLDVRWPLLLAADPDFRRAPHLARPAAEDRPWTRPRCSWIPEPRALSPGRALGARVADLAPGALLGGSARLAWAPWRSKDGEGIA